MKTKIRCECISIKEEKCYYCKDTDIQYSIELEPPNDVSDIYFKMSGGSNFELKTINLAAAEMFEVGEFYDVYIEPSSKPKK